MESKCNTQEKFKQLQIFIDNMEDRRGALIAVLHKAQKLYGYLSNDVIFYIAEKLEIPSAKVFGVISFYSYFTTVPRGKYVINVSADLLLS